MRLTMASNWKGAWARSTLPVAGLTGHEARSAERLRTSTAKPFTLVVVTNSAFPRCNPVDVTVPPGSPVRADISCDTGIR